MSSEPSNIHAEGEAHAETMTRGSIVRIFLILLGITCVEFFIALYMVPQHHMSYHSANPVYIVLTLAKAFYIVAYFMHLKFERLGLIYSLIIPIIFIIGLILVLTNESHHWAYLLGL
ncbi:cytochrome C oxidase subunit IV family protein [Mucilaginibacter paludis]|uniref:Caa(3)-type oxidase, subunit IV n=1 Tax=Mucilaginibacter paludis DSM 18603 TaxID=714943 RepID=H1Y2J4_9SPHI|nr:cytochrome C oxidase subunit IV family protein [Mucilaginibacter paludis]EHQ28042.1 hypothetical protein Mucpa_3951 [Mucilaginibacter paludis DSM 18603]